MSKLYTEKEIKRRLENPLEEEITINEFIESLNPIQLPTDEEIKEEVSKLKFSKEGYKGGVIEGMIWMRDKIKGGNNE